MLILGVAIIMIFVYVDGLIWNPILVTVAMGIACSLLAWDAVAIYDLIVETKAQFRVEKIAFQIKTQGIMENITKEIQQVINETTLDKFISSFNQETEENRNLWKYIYSEIEKLEEYIELLPIEQRIFVLSTDYMLFKNYIDRCFWLLTAHVAFDKDKCECRTLYKKFTIIKKDVGTITIEEFTKLINQCNKFAVDAQKLKNIDLNGKPLRIPKTILQERIGSVLCSKATSNWATKTDDRISFLPYVEFEKIVLNKYKWYTLMIDLLNLKHKLFMEI